VKISPSTIPYRRVLFWYSLLFGIFLLLSNLFIYEQHKAGLEQEFENGNRTVLNLLALLGRESLLSGNYSLIEWFLCSWGEAHDDITFLQMEGDNGFLIADFHKSDNPGPSVIMEQEVRLVTDKLFTIRMGVSKETLNSQLNRLRFQLFGASVAAILILSLTIWLLLKQLAIGPLEREIQQRILAENETGKQRQFLQSVIDGVNDGIMVIGTDYHIIMSNQSARSEMHQAHFAGTDQMKCYELFFHRTEPCMGAEMICPMAKVIENGQAAAELHNHPDSSGRPRYYELAASPLRDVDGKVQGIIECTRDLTSHLLLRDELEEKKMHLEHLANHDALTGLPNRVLLIDRLNQGINSARRSGETLALLFIDLDNFKTINDRYGHDIGDEFLKVAANRLERNVREVDTVARFGGDEFIVALTGLRDMEVADGVTRKLIQEIRQPVCFNSDSQDQVTCSIGISVYPQDGDTAEVLMQKADKAMYQAKESGRNNYRFYS
jgi:diguanylate cyclase (GGDEF)-like protein